MDSREFAEELDGLEHGLDRLRAKYELYFQGIERIEPQRDREVIERGMRRLLRELPNNTSLRFRFNTFKQKLITMKTYWARVSRQIEEGTYRRHLKKAKKRFGIDQNASKKDEPKKRVFELDMEADGDIDLDQLFGNMTNNADDKVAASRMTRQRTPGALPAVPKRPSRAPEKLPQRDRSERQPNLAQSAKKVGASLPPQRPSAPKQAQASAHAAHTKPQPPSPHASKPQPHSPQASRPQPPSPHVSRPQPPSPHASKAQPPNPHASKPQAASAEDRYRQVYDHYLEARRKNNQRIDHLRYEAVAGKLAKMVPQLEAKHKGKKIDFKVVVQDGKVGIKPVAKKT